MASSGDTHLLSCSICFENKANKKPRGLPCQHSFCLECLQQWHETRVQQGKDSSTSVECPFCRQKTSLSSKGIVGLPIDFKVSEAAELMGNREHEFLCQTCLQDGLSNPMTAYCQTCSRRLCQNCVSRHKQVKLFAEHLISNDVCVQHRVSVEYLCLTCLDRLCTDCVLRGIHQEHDIVDIKNADTEIKRLFDRKRRDLETFLANFEKDINNEISLSRASGDYLKIQADHYLETLKTTLDQQFSTLIHKHEEEHERTVAEFYQGHLKVSDDAKLLARRCTQLLRRSKVSPKELKDMSQQIGKVTNELKSSDKLPKAHLILSECCGLNGHDMLKKAIASCTISCQIKDVLTKVQIMEIPELVIRKQCGNGYDIIAPAHIRILPDGSLVVNDYKQEPTKIDLSGKRTLIYAGHNGCRAICVNDGNLYLVTSGGTEVVMYSVTGEKKTYKAQPPLGDVHQIHVEGNDIYILYTTRGIERRSLQNLKQRKEIVSASHICSFLLVPNGDSFKFYCTNYLNNTVVVYGESGALLDVIGSSGTGNGQLRAPADIKQLASGNIIVADKRSNRIVEFETNGKFVRNLLTQEEGISSPDDMDYKHPYLWIAQEDSVLLFKFT